MFAAEKVFLYYLKKLLKIMVVFMKRQNIGPVSENILNQWVSLLFRDYGLFKIMFISFTSYLIVEQFYTFVVVKPTYSSKMRRDLDLEDLPEIFLCPQPAINIDVARSKGYLGLHEYFHGIGPNWLFGSEQLGWGGNNSESVKNVSQEIASMKTIENCPVKDSAFWYKDKDKKSIMFESVQYNLSRVLYPNHICCKVVPPKFSKVYPIMGMQFVTPSKKKSSELFILSMADRLTASYFDQHKATMLGDKIITESNELIIYKVKIFEEIGVEGNPVSPCINYQFEGNYSECLEGEILKQNFHFLNCTPPWMTNNEDHWCQGKYRLNSSLARMNYLTFLSRISVGEKNFEKCYTPCKVKRYHSRKIGPRQGSNSTGIIVWFEKEVEITKSEFTLNPTTLISKFGGFIGISKNFLWIMITIISSAGVLRSRFNILKQ